MRLRPEPGLAGGHATPTEALAGSRCRNLVAGSPEMRQLIATLRKLSPSQVNVLIEGESGTGKELIARAIHYHSFQGHGPLVAVNCGALTRDLARNELFGHRRGAFTGASEDRPGAFEVAHGGTLFLDEIAELPLEVQPLLLRALDEGIVTRMGEHRPRPVEVRLLAATHRELQREVQAGRFREDLYFRVAVVRVAVPPLRGRTGEVRILASYFAAQLGAVLPEYLLEQLETYAFPGNVRELKNIVEAYTWLGLVPNTTGAAGSTPSLPCAVSPLAQELDRAIDLARPYAELKEEVVTAFTRAYLQRLLGSTGGNQSEAARRSGLERRHLGRLLQRFGLDSQ